MKKLYILRKLTGFCVFLAFILLFAGWGVSQTSVLASMQAGPAILAGSGLVLALLGLATLLFGRIYCSLLCPLGLLQDGMLYLRKKDSFQPLKHAAWLKFSLLCLAIFALLTGIMLPFALIDPYSAFGRIASSFFAPLIAICQNGIAWMSQLITAAPLPTKTPAFSGWPAMLGAVATLALLAYLVFRHGRAWCNICPIGTVLGWLSAKSLFRIRFDSSSCIRCGKCEKACKTGSIDLDNQKIDHRSCVVCLKCAAICPKSALSYSLGIKHNEENANGFKPDLAKRAFLRSSLALAAMGAVSVQELPAAEIDKLNRPDILPTRRQRAEREIPVTPPGSGGLAHFQKHCTGCQLCVGVCPNNVLATSPSGPGLLQPGMSFEAGYCRPNCARCGAVCPAGAILPITPATKKSVQIGIAKTDFAKCIVNTDQVNCTACERICANQAISLVPIANSQQQLRRPQVDSQKCTGCGACEYICPAKPLAAIAVKANKEHQMI